MKHISIVLAVPLLMSACGDHAQPGSSLAARFAAAEAVGKMRSVDPVEVRDEPVFDGDIANVSTVFNGGACQVELVKRMDANKYGWVAKAITCDKTT